MVQTVATVLLRGFSTHGGSTEIGPEKSFTLLIRPNSFFLGLTIQDIEDLDLMAVPNGKIRMEDGDNGEVEVMTYKAMGTVLGMGLSPEVIPTSAPFIGFNRLEARGLRINAATNELEKSPCEADYPLLKTRSLYEPRGR